MTIRASHDTLYELAGWYGMTAILAAYCLVSFGVIDSHSVIFQILNLTGALGIIVISYRKRVMQTIALNIVWLLVATVALIQAIFIR